MKLRATARTGDQVPAEDIELFAKALKRRYGDCGGPYSRRMAQELQRVDDHGGHSVWLRVAESLDLSSRSKLKTGN